MEVRSLMSRPVATVGRGVSLKDAAKKMSQKGIGCVVVAEKKMPIGILTKFDLVCALSEKLDPAKTAVESVMHTPVMPIEETEDLFNAARQMDRFDVRRFIIVDASNRLCGIVTSNNIIKAFAQRAFPFNQSISSIAQPGLTVTPKTPLRKVARAMHDTRHKCAVVIKAGKPAGTVCDDSFVKLTAKSSKPMAGNAGDKMHKKVCIVSADASLREAVLKMLKSGHREIIVTTGDDRYFGVVTQRDLVSFIEKSQL